MRDYNCLSSDDLVNWRDEGIVFSMDTVTWAVRVGLAPNFAHRPALLHRSTPGRSR